MIYYCGGKNFSENSQCAAFQKNFELYEGLSPGLVFELRHSSGESHIFTAENDNLVEKWMMALRYMSRYSVSALRQSVIEGKVAEK